MSSLQYYSYDGYGKRVLNATNYSQAVRVGDLVQISGQGGWDPKTEVISLDLPTQVEQAFSNVELTLKDAGVAGGWDQVFRLNTYHVPMDNQVLALFREHLKKWCPNHAPIATAVGVQRLAFDEMRIEIEVQAYDPKK